MDIQTPLIFVFLFSIGSVLLVLIYKFGIKEKSYEEALAEQRQQTHVLLGIKPTKSKTSKDKKSKKPPKKVKISNDQVEPDNEEQETEEALSTKHHVEFKEVPEQVPITVPTVTAHANKSHSKKDKVRSILVHKSKAEKELPAPVIEEAVNHFEEIQPKDAVKLLHSNEEPIKSNASPEPEQLSKTQKSAETPTTNTDLVIGNLGKEKKKKKSEFNTLQQLAGDSSKGPNMTILLNLVRKAELSRNEVQLLIDLLLNKQHDAPTVMDDWSEGKADPVQKLKKQLAEKERLLEDEQQVTQNTQTKLRSIRTEHQNEKSQLVQKIRELEEAFHGKHAEAGHLHQQLQQLQVQSNEQNNKLREEHAAIQIHRQQIEMRLIKAQENEVMNAQFQKEIQDLTNLNNQLRIELNRFVEDNDASNDQLRSCRVEIEELNNTCQNLERNLEQILSQENDSKNEISRLTAVLQQQNEELRRVEHGKAQFTDEFQRHKEESGKLITELKTTLQGIQEENNRLQNTHINGALQETKQHQVEIFNLHNELSSIKTKLVQSENKYETDVKNTNSLVDKLQQQLAEEQKQLEEQKLKNDELRTKNWKVMEALKAAESRTNKPNIQLKAENGHKELLQRLLPEVPELKTIKSDNFQDEAEKYIRKFIADLQTPAAIREDESDNNTVQLKSQVQHYKNVIDNTEKMLNKLQQQIEQEELKWRVQLATTTAELESVKEAQKLQLNERIATLEKALSEEKDIKKKALAELQEYRKSSGKAMDKLTNKCNNTSNGLHH